MGCLPIQRIDRAAAKKLLRRAYDSGINYFDTLYDTDSTGAKNHLALAKEIIGRE